MIPEFLFNKKLGVCLCALKGDKVLAVARRNSVDQWGLPGGKIEPGESMIDALVREVQEETRIVLDKNKLRPVFSRVDDSFFVVTYFYQGKIEEKPRQGDAGPVEWVTWDQLIIGPFGIYNSRLKARLGL